MRGGQLAVVPSLASLTSELPGLLARFPDTSEPVDTLNEPDPNLLTPNPYLS